MSTHNLCFRAKIRKNVYPMGVYNTRVCYDDGVLSGCIKVQVCARSGKRRQTEARSNPSLRWAYSGTFIITILRNCIQIDQRNCLLSRN